MIELKITLDETTGNINVTGPLTNKLLCFGLLGAASDVVSKHQEPTSPIVKPDGLKVPHLHLKN